MVTQAVVKPANVLKTETLFVESGMFSTGI